jgi:hypothetical protein
MGENVDFDMLGNETIMQAFQDAWEADIAESDGHRTYNVAKVRRSLETAGVDYHRVLRMSTEALDIINGRILKIDEITD